MLRLGVDLGGTKTVVAVFDASGSELVRRRVPTPGGDYRAALEDLVQLIRDAEHAAGAPCTVGIGIPGAISRTDGRVKNAYNTVLNGQPFKRDLEALLGHEVRLANDANCFALSEAADGAARGARIVFGAILGTGVGGGIVADGRIVEGRNAISGEWGHNPLPWMAQDEFPGPACSCGRLGCIEQFVSGHALSRELAASAGELLDPPEIAARADRGDLACRVALERYEERLARALAHVVNLLDPDTIVLGGGLSNIARLYGNVASLLPRHVYSDSVTTPIVPAAHGDASGVRGATRLWVDPGA